MARLLDRLQNVNAPGLPRGLYTWAQRVCEQIEAAFVDIASQITDITTLQTQMLAALSSMPDIADVHISADYTGTINAGQLPRNVIANRYTGDTDHTADATWSFTSSVITGSITNGVLTITDVDATGRVTITSDYNGVEKSRSFTVYLDVAAPPATGTGGGGGGTAGTSASDTTFASISSATHAAISDELTVTVGSGGQVQLSAPLDYYADADAPNATLPIYAIWRHYSGGSYVDVGTETASSPSCQVTEPSPGVYTVSNGRVAPTQTVTGLVSGTTEKFQLYARNVTGTRTIYFSGTASAVAS